MKFGTKLIFKLFFYSLIAILLFAGGCIAPPRTQHTDTEDYEEEIEAEFEELSQPDSVGYLPYLTEADHKLSNGDVIFKYAFGEQQKKMYAKNSDCVYLYWLKNKKLELKGRTKCNIFAINTLFKAGFLTPKQNARTVDLMNESLFNDVFPVANVTKPSHLKKGDLIIWNGHVIIYDTLAMVKNDIYAKAIWAGTGRKDNGKTIRNNVCYGKYPLSGNFIVRRPIRKK